MTNPLPLYFTVGGTYEDERGKYTVISIQNGGMEIERTDGRREQSRDIKLKENIDRRISRERNGPARSESVRRSASFCESSYPTYDEAHPILATVRKELIAPRTRQPLRMRSKKQMPRG